MAKAPQQADAPAPSIEDRVAALEANSHPPVDLSPAIEAGVEAILAERLPSLLNLALEARFPPGPDKTEGFSTAVLAVFKPYLDANLEKLVKAAMPPTPEQLAKVESETFAERMRKQQDAAARQAKRDAKLAAKLADEAAADQAKRDAAAAKAFDDATPFVGDVKDITASILRGIRIDDGKAYSANHDIAVRMGDLEMTTDGALLLTKPIELAARGREFSVKGVSLITDAGRLRIELGGQRKAGGGKAVSFPARSLLFRAHMPSAADAAQG